MDDANYTKTPQTSKIVLNKSVEFKLFSDTHGLKDILFGKFKIGFNLNRSQSMCLTFDEPRKKIHCVTKFNTRKSNKHAMKQILTNTQHLKRTVTKRRNSV